MFRGHLKRQVLDRLHEAYSFPLIPALVDREFAVLWKTALADLGTRTIEPKVRASQAAEFREIAELARRMKAKANLRADGGAAANSWLMQFQADMLGLPVEVAPEREMTAIGAAALAAGHPPSRAPGAVYEPRMSRDQADALYRDWLAAIQRTVLDQAGSATGSPAASGATPRGTNTSVASRPLSASPAPARKAAWKPSTSAGGQ